MKKVIFLCIVSFAVCFVAGNSTPPAQPSPTLSTKDPKPETTTLKASEPDKHEATTNNLTSSTTASPAHATTETNVTTETKPAEITTKKANPTAANVTSTAPPISSTTPAAGSKNDTVTSTPQSTPKTDSSTKAAEPEPKLARGFDGASFTGGIILTLGLLAIGFMGFKYYKNQTERNYHTL